MRFLNNITADHIRGLLVIIAVLAVIIGFFMQLVPSEIFSAIIGMIITHYYQGNKVTELHNKVSNQEAEIQSLKSDNGQEKNI